MNGVMAEGLMDVAEAGEFLGVSRMTLYRLMDAGKLGYVKIGRARRIPKRALVELAEQNWIGPQPAMAAA